MWDLFEWALTPVIDLFVTMYRADERPEARRSTIGCLLVVVAIIVFGVLFYYFG